MIWVIFGVAKKFDMGGQKVRHEFHVELFDFDEMKRKGMVVAAGGWGRS